MHVEQNRNKQTPGCCDKCDASTAWGFLYTKMNQEVKWSLVSFEVYDRMEVRYVIVVRRDGVVLENIKEQVSKLYIAVVS